jgi:hypothetical protein
MALKSEVIEIHRVSYDVCGRFAPEAVSEDGAIRNAIHTGWKRARWWNAHDGSKEGADLCPSCAPDFLAGLKNLEDALQLKEKTED